MYPGLEKDCCLLYPRLRNGFLTYILVCCSEKKDRSSLKILLEDRESSPLGLKPLSFLGESMADGIYLPLNEIIHLLPYTITYRHEVVSTYAWAWAAKIAPDIHAYDSWMSIHVTY